MSRRLLSQVTIEPAPDGFSTTASGPTGLPYPVTTVNAKQAKSQIDRERIRADFYATYDVMTGVRIAATLGGFFGLMVFLVVYKSRSKSHKALKDPRIVAQAQADALQQERRELRQALEQAALESLVEATQRGDMKAARRSLDVGATCAAWTAYNTRFSSVGGGYSSLLAPGHRLSRLRHASLPGSALGFNSSSHYLMQSPMVTPRLYPRRLHEPQYSVEEEEVDDSILDNDIVPSKYHLTVPRDSRRCSSATCSSTDTSYMERRGSWFINEAGTSMGLGDLDVPHKRISDTHGNIDIDSSYYPIDIQVIGATPHGSPQPVRRQLERQRALDLDDMAGQSGGRAPLASIGSYAEHWTSEIIPGDDTDEDFDDGELLSSEEIPVGSHLSVQDLTYREDSDETTLGRISGVKTTDDCSTADTNSDPKSRLNEVQLRDLTETRTHNTNLQKRDSTQETLF